MNKVFLMGNLTKDVEVRNTPAGKMLATTSLATNKKWKDEAGNKQEKTEFHNLVIWNGAEAFAKYLSKGSKVFIEGEIQTDSYKDKNTGENKYSTKINVREFTFLDSKKQDNEPNAKIDGYEGMGSEVNQDEISISDIPF